jgi:hypothetical protein
MRMEDNSCAGPPSKDIFKVLPLLISARYVLNTGGFTKIEEKKQSVDDIPKFPVAGATVSTKGITQNKYPRTIISNVFELFMCHGHGDFAINSIFVSG